MSAKARFSLVAALAVLAFLTVGSFTSYAQCYLDQGCAPVDFLNYQPNGNGGQVYHGDGASSNHAGGWTTNYSDENQCLSCHYGTNTLPYLWTGHRNTLRKVAPNVVWAGPDGSYYPTTDNYYYASGSTFDWTNGNVIIGWCDPLATPLQNGLPVNDPACKFPFYTLPNQNAPAAYQTVPPTKEGGGLRSIFYLKGGWMHYGGTTNPSATHLDTVFDSGFTGQNYPNGNFDCARCHATGYNFGNWGPEPTSNTNNQVTWIPDSKLARVPSDGYIAPGTNGTSSWYLTGIQCERCHIAAYTWGSHPWDPNVVPTIARNEQATALCMECHRQESITLADQHQPGSIIPTNPIVTNDAGYCSDMSGASYSACLANEVPWVYKPYINHEQGPAFLNSPHARFTGNLVQNSQNSADLTITIAGTYASQFSETIGDPSKNLGCTGCHDPHQSTSPAVAKTNAPNPIVNTCDTCHQLSKNILTTINHPMGPGTPFPTGTSADIPGACVTCHMQGALGQPNSHLFRINTDVDYRTFPTPDQLYLDKITGLGTSPEYSPLDGTYFNAASWLDVDLACGQCHVGGDGVTNPYNLTLPPGMPGAHAFTRAQLAQWAYRIHAGDPTTPAPTFAPDPGVYSQPVTVAISDSMNGATIYYTTDGSTPDTNSPVYTSPITITTTTTFKAMATYPGLPRSTVILAVYSINLPTAPAPIFNPPPATYGSARSVTMSNTASLPMYYTVDGSEPTTKSTPYAGPISITENTTLKAITAGYGYQTSQVTTGNYYIQAPTPKISPKAGTYYQPVEATISDTVTGATIFYTTDGSMPTTGSTSCANPCSLTISTTTTLKAIASGGGYAASSVAVAAYTIAAQTPTFAPSSGTYNAPLSVKISDTTAGVTIYYAINGFPDSNSPSCSSPCSITLTETGTNVVRAIASGNGYSQSATGLATYTLK